MIIFVGLKMQVGYIQIILSDHVFYSGYRNSNKFLIDIDVALWQ